jgi:hypothetical protein
MFLATHGVIRNNAGISTLWNNLRAYYKADNTTNDAKGTANGTLVNGATYGTGIINQGFSLDGVAAYIGFSNVLNFDGSAPFSFSWWVKLNSTSYNVNFGKFAGGFYGYEIANSGGNIRLYMASGSGTLDLTSNCGVTSGNWFHIVLTYDGSKTASGVKFYSNGILKTNNAPATNNLTGSIATTGNLSIGCRTGGSFFVNGVMDEIGVWDKVLTATEVTELYNSGNGKQYPN